MASLSEDMKSKRDVRRKHSVLIIDRDLGNFGLYKSILAMEYELECINTIAAAVNLCKNKVYDVVLVDGGFAVSEVKVFYKNVSEQYGKDRPILLVLEEQSNKESIISYLSIGAREYISKPFSREGITNVIYDQLKKRRENAIRQSILIVDEDYNQLKELKGYLSHNYNVSIVNSYELANQFVTNRTPDLVICDMKIFEMCIDDECICSKEDMGNTANTANTGKWTMPVLLITDTPDAETISKCAKYNPEGFLMKPIEKDMLLKTLERIILMESYTGSGR